MSEVAYKKIRITGAISVEPYGGKFAYIESRVILLVGPTGSGKSSFIEALAGPESLLGIAKDQLEGFTQELSAFKLSNVIASYSYNNQDYPIYIVDCPGFADKKLSENEIILKIRKWMGDKNLGYFDHVLYFTPITDTRLPRSKRHIITMLRELFGNNHKFIIVVTTMWDTICNDGMRLRADNNLSQLDNDVWTDSTLVTKFHNTQDSSLKVLDDVLRSIGWIESSKFSCDRAPQHAYDNLIERIAMAQQEIQFADHEITQPKTESNEEARQLAVSQREDAHERLKRFSRQFADLGPPPSQKGNRANIHYGVLLESITVAQQNIQVSKHELSQRSTKSNKESRRIALVRGQEAYEFLQRVSSQMTDYGHPPPVCEPLDVPWDLLSTKQHLKQAWGTGKRAVFGSKGRPT